MRNNICRVLFISVFIILFCNVLSIGEVLWAVNCGGDSHVDSNGIKYSKDSLSQGTASDYGKSMLIQRIGPQDQLIYQTERFHTQTFGYEIPISSDGDYVLILKFSEVWFTAPNQKVFDVQLNNEHIIVERLDIFSRVGRGAAHDEIIPFRVKEGRLYVNGESSDLYYNKISLEFIKGDRDNPKVNGIVLMRGFADDVPKLPPVQGFDADEQVNDHIERDNIDHQYQQTANANSANEDDEEEIERSKRRRPVSGPKTPDPYATDDTSTMLLPILVAIGCFLPILFCLCKL